MRFTDRNILLAIAALSAAAMLYVGAYQVRAVSHLSCPLFGHGCEAVADAPFVLEPRQRKAEPELGRLPRAAELRRTLEEGYTIRRSDLVDFNDLSDGGMAFRAAKAREYMMAGGVSLPAAMAALRRLAPVLAPAPS